MHPAPVATTDSQPIAVPYWVTGEPAPDNVLDLAVYPEEDEGVEDLIRATEARLSRFALATAIALFAYMLVRLGLAWHAGRF